jgi:hypothetical protein
MTPDHVRKRRSGVVERPRFLKGFLKALRVWAVPQSDLQKTKVF